MYALAALNLQLLINVVVICAAFQLSCLDRYLVIVWVYLLSFVNAGLVFCAHYALAHGMQFFYFPAV